MASKGADRLVTTCRACRRRKVGCDRQRPSCRQCRASGITCVYESQAPRSYHFIQETPGGSSSQVSSVPDVDEIDAPSTVVVPENRVAALESRVESLSNMLASLRQSSSGGTSPFPPASADDERTFPTNTNGYLSQQGGGKVRYINASSWNAMCRDASEIDEILYSQSQDPPEYDAETALAGSDGSSVAKDAIDNVAGVRPAISIPSESQSPFNVPVSFWREFPSKNFCDAALKWYFRGCHPPVPLVHIPSFRRDYEHFWSCLHDQGPNITSFISFATLVLSFLYAGVVGSGEQQHLVLPGLNVNDTMAKLHRLTSRALKLARFPHAPTLDTFRAYLLQQASRMREEEPLTSIAFVGLSLRVANILGLHKDPRHFPQLSRIEGEVRRRIWWQLVHIDVCLAVAAGLPPLIELQSWDVQPISELKDELIGTDEGTQYENDTTEGRLPAHSADNPCDISATAMVSTSGILAASKYRFTLQRRYLLRVETGMPATIAQEIIPRLEELGDQLRLAIDRIPDCAVDEIVEAGPDSAYGSSLVLNRWARLLISTYRDQRFCLVSHPITRVPNWPGLDDFHMQYGNSWQSIESSISFLYKCAKLSTNTFYQRFQWSWPGNHQPLHAIILLLNNVLYSISTQYLEQIRSVIDIIAALASENAGLVGNRDEREEDKTRVLSRGGSEVWKYLSRLRARAWRKRGWDPTTRLSREQAVALCQRLPEDVDPSSGPTEAVEGASSAASRPAPTVTEGFSMPMAAFLGDDEMVDPEHLNPADFTPDPEIFGDFEGFWYDHL